MIREHNPWGRLEGFDDLDSRAELLYGTVTAFFDDMVKTGQPLIETDYELQFPLIRSYTDTLTDMLGYDTDLSAQETVYRAMHFGHLLAVQLIEAPKFRPVQYFDLYDESLDYETRITTDTQAYFQHRPALDSLVGRYVHEIDHTTRLPIVAEKVAALTLLQIDMSARQNFIESETGAFAVHLQELDAIE